MPTEPTPEDLQYLKTLEHLSRHAVKRYERSLRIFQTPLEEMTPDEALKVTRIRIRRFFSPNEVKNIIDDRRRYAFWLVRTVTEWRDRFFGPSGPSDTSSDTSFK